MKKLAAFAIVFLFSLTIKAQGVLPLTWDAKGGTNAWVYSIYVSVNNATPALLVTTSNNVVTLTNAPVRSATYWVTARFRIADGYSLESDFSVPLTNATTPANVRALLLVP